MKYVNKMKRNGRKVLPAQEDKNLEKNLEENDKKYLNQIGRRERAKSFFEKLNKVKNT